MLQASYDAGIKNIVFGATAATATTYCISSTVGPYTFVKNGPSSDIKLVGSGSPAVANCT